MSLSKQLLHNPCLVFFFFFKINLIILSEKFFTLRPSYIYVLLIFPSFISSKVHCKEKNKNTQIFLFHFGTEKKRKKKEWLPVTFSTSFYWFLSSICVLLHESLLVVIRSLTSKISYSVTIKVHFSVGKSLLI